MTPQKYFIGIDLHSTKIDIAVAQSTVTEDGSLKLKWVDQIVLKSLQKKGIIKFLEPYCQGSHCIAVESTYNWYWLVNALNDKGWTVHLIDSMRSLVERGKFSDDQKDARALAEGLYAGTLKFSSVLDKSARAKRDFCRSRGELAETLAQLKTRLSAKLQNYTGRRTVTDSLLTLSMGEIKELLPCQVQQEEIKESLATIMTIKKQIQNLDSEIEKLFIEDQSFALLKSIPGCGPVLAATIAGETADIGRFKDSSHYLSYCGLVSNRHYSNGRQKRRGSSKEYSSEYLRRAFFKLAIQHLRSLPDSDRSVKRLRQSERKIVWRIAQKLARVVYQMLRKKEAFDSSLQYL